MAASSRNTPRPSWRTCTLVDNEDKKKPGYPAKYEDLMPGQKIILGDDAGRERRPGEEG